MDTETFEQVALQENMVDAPQFLKDGQEVTVIDEYGNGTADGCRAS